MKKTRVSDVELSFCHRSVAQFFIFLINLIFFYSWTHLQPQKEFQAFKNQRQSLQTKHDRDASSVRVKSDTPVCLCSISCVFLVYRLRVSQSYSFPMDTLLFSDDSRSLSEEVEKAEPKPTESRSLVNRMTSQNEAADGFD